MRNAFLSAVAACALLAATSVNAVAAGEHVEAVKEYVTKNVVAWLSDKVLVDAIKAQNAKHEALDASKIDELDKKWRAEVNASDRPLITSVMSNGVSAFLAKKKADAAGLISEVFVMDNKGLNVGQSDVTSDYWQGDEAKWKKTFLVSPDAIFVDEIEMDQSSQQLQAQVSVSIKDPANGKAIGAITIGVNVDKL